MSTLLFCETVTSNAFYPEIPQLVSKDKIFKQYIQSVEESYIAIASGDEVDLSIYKYKAVKGDTLLRIASRCSLPYETIAGINKIDSPDAIIEGKTLFLPTAAGLYFREPPVTVIDRLLYKKYIANEDKKCYIINGEKVYYIINGRFTSTERAFFLDTSLILPLADSVLTSSFGMRVSPITGTLKFHEGIDLASPIGTPVYACKRGVVQETGTDPVYGNYILIQHDGGMQSKYAHLSQINVTKGREIDGGEQIGLVGMTGAATGPHLHFEIHINGAAVNPETKL